MDINHSKGATNQESFMLNTFFFYPINNFLIVLWAQCSYLIVMVAKVISQKADYDLHSSSHQELSSTSKMELSDKKQKERGQALHFEKWQYSLGDAYT